MDDREKLRKRLNRLGQRKTARPTPGLVRKASAPRTELPGREIETPAGFAFRIEIDYPFTYQHGHRQLSDLSGFHPSFAAQVAKDPALGGVGLSDLVFLDTETTGLVGGAGTIAFLVGIGFFSDSGFELRQYFLRDPGEERSMLLALEQDLLSRAAFVTFNGRAFDVPLLEMRYSIGARKRWQLSQWPHFDLLYPARRLWRRTLPNCRLGTIEQQVLDVRRTDEDVPGELIPGLYLDYLRSGDVTEMRKVVYHNAVDILSLVGLTAEILQKHDQGGVPALEPGEALGLARWHHGAGRSEEARTAYRAALEGDDADVKVEALRHYTLHLKREDRREEAISSWELWHDLAAADPRPCIELAMYYEWHADDLEQARGWAREALLCLSHWPAGWRREQMWDQIEHRLRRITRKLEHA
ncbi:MAG: ribonuclease H-like domain-containing protein [Anaerolineales bacterium]|nr:ribonuclease H-like domain-containing protein [Anaerolineales bacterium]